MLKNSLTLLMLSATLSGSPPSSAGTASIAATELPAATAIKLDGAFTEAVWEHVPAVSDFRQRDPKDGAAPTFATEVKVAYDASNLYVAIRAHDPEPDRLVGLRTRRDTDSPSDWLKVIIDSFHDRRTAFEFGVNPAGVKEDRAWSNDGNSDSGWDAVWDVAVSRDKDGWRAEFRIPFSQLRFQPSDNATFGFAVVRQIGRLNETDTWPLISKSAPGVVSSFGDLTGLKLTRTPKRLELMPYVVGQVSTQPSQPGNPLISSRDQKGTVGADLKYALRPGVTLTATVNPDFGQVEADPAVVNLSGFETFFSERRPFFVEGAGTFAFNMDCNDGACSGLFYPRRIGRAPRGSPELGEGMYATVPQQTKIWGAAKLTGHLGGFSFGALNALTADEQATIANGAQRLHQSVEPMANYSVVRARREFANQSSVGFMLTGTMRRVNAFTSFLPRRAITGGADWDVRLRKAYAVQGYWVGSTIHGTADAIDRLQRSTVHSFQRPDADHVEENPLATSLNGDSGAIGLSKIAGAKVRFNTNVGFKSPGFDSNDLGFTRRADIRTMGNWIQFRNETPSKHLRSWRFNLNQWGAWNFGGDRLDLGGNVNAHWRFTNNWGTGTGLTVNAPRFDDRATRGGGPGAYRNQNVTSWGYIEMDDRKPVTPATFFNVGSDHHGTRWFGISPGVTVRPTSFLSVSGGVDWNHEVQDAQWIQNTADGHYVFGRLDQKTVSFTARVNYTITPQLSVQVYAAPFVSAGGYGSFKELVNGRAARYEDRYAPIAYAANPDFNYRSFRTTNVLRWEYKPGSALFVVWQQGREDVLDTGRFQFGRDFRGVFGAPSRNVFLVKWSYWINQ
jgi:uncharacterized protein DUF5916/cellulose/xylan binding protein with CBM9 domain